MTGLLQEGVLAWLGVVFAAGGAGLGVLGSLTNKKQLGRTARWVTGCAGYLFLLSLTARGVAVNDWPLASTYELILLSAAAVAVTYALTIPRRLETIGAICAGVTAFLLAVLALARTPAAARVPHVSPPAFQGIWFPLHAITTALGYGGLFLAGCAGLFRLVTRTSDWAESSLPGDLEALAWRGLAWGYPWLTLGMTLGALWGWRTWGQYWTWSPKEVLTLLAWGVFTLAFHTRRQRGWRGRPHAAVLVAGLIAIVLTLVAAEALARRAVPPTLYVF